MYMYIYIYIYIRRPSHRAVARRATGATRHCRCTQWGEKLLVYPKGQIRLKTLRLN